VSRQGPNSNPVVQGKLRSREKLVEIQRVADIRSVMDSPEGRRFMYTLIFDRCGVMSVYPGSDSGIYRSEGRRQMGAEIVMDLQLKMPDRYMMMITEHLNDLTNEQRLRDAATTDPGDDDA
jgi:hypothetical protein